MRLKQLVSYLLDQKGAEESYPFGPDTLVFKVKGKMFALIGYRDQKDFINLKADPNDIPFLTEEFVSICPGYHMNKRHWISVEIGHDENELILTDLIKVSYQLVKAKLTKAQKAELEMV